MALVNLESYYSANVTAGVDLLPLIRENINTKKDVKLSESIQLRSVTIYSEDGNVFTINGFDFEIRNGSWSSPVAINVDYISITSLIPKQSGEVVLYYLR